jgi:hypothetical protein
MGCLNENLLTNLDLGRETNHSSGPSGIMESVVKRPISGYRHRTHARIDQGQRKEGKSLEAIATRSVDYLCACKKSALSLQSLKPIFELRNLP